MISWRFKSCPRCRGDTYIDRDIDGWYEQCLLCSHRRELKDLSRYQKQPVRAGSAEKTTEAG